MINYKQGNLLDVKEGVIVHGCNAKGVMGSGVALAVKDKYAKAYTSYKTFEESKGLRVGGVNLVNITKKLYVANAITQASYGRDSEVRYVSYGGVLTCFEKLNEHFPLNIPFHFPKIGAGLGGGDWEVISSLIELACPQRELVCWTL